ncbi:MAG: sigma-70 family RNA polymerase sigma factor [Nitrospirota bacterium]
MIGPGAPYGTSTDVDRVVAEFTPVIRFLAERLSFRLPPYLDINDLIHVGVIGLMDAIDKFDPTKEVKFKTYAEVRIRGAMLDEIRSLAWVPRSVREKVGLLHKTNDALEKRLGRPPTDEETAAALGMDAKQFALFTAQACSVALLSLDDLGALGEEDRDPLESVADPQAADPLRVLIAEDSRRRVLAAIDALPNKERLVVSLYYVEELTMKEIGRVLKITESRVCQLHAQAIHRLQGAIGGFRDAA